MNLTLDRLRYFLEASKLEHVGLTGKSLGVSPSAVSSAIAMLEDEFQCKLFDRSQKRIHLNDKGRLLRARVEPIFGQLQSLAHEVSSQKVEFHGHFTVGASHFLALHHLQVVLNDLQTAHPDLRTENSPLRTSQVVQDVLAGTLDFGFCFSPQGHPNLERQTLFTGELVVAVSKTHPIAKVSKKRNFSIKQLNHFPAVLHQFAPGVDYCEEHPMFKRFGIEPKTEQTFHSDDLCVQTLAGGKFWTLIPDVVARAYQTKLYCVPLPKGWKSPYEICSIYRKVMKNSALHLALDSLLAKNLGT